MWGTESVCRCRYSIMHTQFVYGLGLERKACMHARTDGRMDEGTDSEVHDVVGVDDVGGVEEGGPLAQPLGVSRVQPVLL